MRRLHTDRPGGGRNLFARGAGVVLGLAMAIGGCSENKPQPEKAEVRPQYETLPPKQVPEFMKGTVHEIADVVNKDPYPVAGFGLVVNLAGTGSNENVNLAVRNYLIDQMVRHGFGSNDERMKHVKEVKPEGVLKDPRTAIVEVHAALPPGAREGQRMDVWVRSARGSQTSSLARGWLYLTDLKVNGADELNPKGSINIFGKARGPVFVNPAYTAMDGNDPRAKASLRTGVVMNGGIVLNDRPIQLRVRAPQLSVSRGIETRIDQRFEENGVARTQDEAIINVLVPRSYNGDWEHFLGVLTHMYMNGAPGFGAVKAKELAGEAVKPDAPLKDISYCWEAIGAESLPFIQSLYGHGSADVAFAAARAGAFLNDSVAEDALLNMARNDANPFQINAVKALAARPASTRIDRMMQEVLAESKNVLVRVEAYHALVEHESPLVISRAIDTPHATFVLDRVPSGGEPLVYATRTGVPRIALIGRGMPLTTPLMFRAMGDQFTISTGEDERVVTMFDRTGGKAGGAVARTRPDLHEIVWTLSGGEPGFRMGYSDIVGIVKSLSDGKHLAARFVLQDLPAMRDEVEDAPPLPEPASAEVPGPKAVSRKE